MKRIVACLVLAVATSGVCPYDCASEEAELDRLWEEWGDHLVELDEVFRLFGLDGEEAEVAIARGLSLQGDIDSLLSELEANGCR